MSFSCINECFQTITDEDVLAAMKKISGYLDITPSDFLQIYQIAFDHAVSRIRTAILAEQVMTQPVIFVKEDDLLIEAVKKMAAHDISGLPVLNDDDRITGVVSEKDFLSRMNKKKAPSFVQVLVQCADASSCLVVPFKTLKVREVMSSPPVTVKKETTMLDVANILDQFNINRVPVSDDNNRLVGIIARSDLVQAMC